MKFMPDSNRNRNGIKGNSDENRTDNNPKNSQDYVKLPDQPRREDEDDVSTAGDTANGKYSRTGKRKEDKEKQADVNAGR